MIAADMTRAKRAIRRTVWLRYGFCNLRWILMIINEYAKDIWTAHLKIIIHLLR